MRRFGLIGYPLSHSFSKQYFTQKFAQENIPDSTYELFPLASLEAFNDLHTHNPHLVGLNVTIPYKEAIIPYMNELDPVAAEIGAVNVLKRLQDGSWKGYNSDAFGFSKTLELCKLPWALRGKKAMIFGSGGSSKAIRFVLKQHDVDFKVVSRGGDCTYQSLTRDQMAHYQIFVNCTPVGMYPQTEAKLPLPFNGFCEGQWVIDLIYNPEKTMLMREAEKRGANTINGLPMLYAQAEKAWEIWNE